MPIAMPIAMHAASLCYRICRAQSDEERAAVESVVQQFFTIESDGCLHNKRADIELGKRKNLSETRASVAKKGAAKRWGNPEPMPIAMPEAVLQGIANGCTSTATATVTSREEEIPPLVPPKGKKVKRMTQLPDDFSPNEGHGEFATKHGLVLAEEIEAFRDYHVARGSVMANWDAALGTWLRNAKKFSAARNKPTKDPRFSAARSDFSNVDYHKGVNADGSF
jgi:hypothetical protein